MVASEQYLYRTILQFDKTIVLPRKLATVSIHYAMAVCRSHDTAESLAHGSSYPDPLAKSRPSGKIQTH